MTLSSFSMFKATHLTISLSHSSCIHVKFITVYFLDSSFLVFINIGMIVPFFSLPVALLGHQGAVFLSASISSNWYCSSPCTLDKEIEEVCGRDCYLLGNTSLLLSGSSESPLRLHSHSPAGGVTTWSVEGVWAEVCVPLLGQAHWSPTGVEKVPRATFKSCDEDAGAVVGQCGNTLLTHLPTCGCIWLWSCFILSPRGSFVTGPVSPTWAVLPLFLITKSITP